MLKKDVENFYDKCTYTVLKDVNYLIIKYFIGMEHFLKSF